MLDNHTKTQRDQLYAAQILDSDRYLVPLSRKLLKDGFQTAAQVAALGKSEIARRYRPSSGALKRLSQALGEFDFTLRP